MRSSRADRLAAAIDDGVAAEADVGDVAVFEIDDLVGRPGQRHRIGGEEGLARALLRPDAEHQRVALARADHALRLGLAEHGDRIGALQFRRRALHGREQVARIMAVDQVRDDLGVGLRLEHVTLGFQARAQLFVVLDDAVVHHRDFVAAEYRVRVDRDRRAVGGPARVADAGRAGEPGLAHLRVEVGHARHGARAPQLSAAAGVVHRDAAGVVAAVFEPAQPFDQYRNDVAPGHRADYAAHLLRFLISFSPAASSPAIVTCFARETVSAPAGASLVSVVPAPSVAPLPTRTGATSCVSEPMMHVVLDDGAVLVGAVVIAGDGAGADVDVAPHRGVADIGEVVGLGARRDLARLHLDEIADVHFLGERGAGAQPRVRADAAARADVGLLEMAEGLDAACRRRPSRCAARSSRRR